MKLEPELRAKFMEEAEAAHRPVSQVLREFVQRQREVREHDKFLHCEVEFVRLSMVPAKGNRMMKLSWIAARRANATKGV